MHLNLSQRSRAFAFSFTFCIASVCAIDNGMGQFAAATTSNSGSTVISKVGNGAVTFYEPVEKQIEGWTIVCDPKLLTDETKKEFEPAFKALANHLQRIAFILPADRLKRIQQCKIWMEVDNPLIKGMQ